MHPLHLERQQTGKLSPCIINPEKIHVALIINSCIVGECCCHVGSTDGGQCINIIYSVHSNLCVAYAYSWRLISVDCMLVVYNNSLAWLTVVRPLIVYEGFLVSVTWIKPRMRLKLSDVLHSTASNFTDRLFSGSTQSPQGWSKNFSVYSFTVYPLG